MFARLLWCLSVLMSAVSFAPAQAADVKKTPDDPAKVAEAKKHFDELFGEEVTRVSATADVSDDIELAGQLLNAARGADETPIMRDLLCEQAFALASKDPAGYPTAAEALKLIAEKNPDKKEAIETRLLGMYQRGYDRATGEKKTAAGELLIDHLQADADAKIAAKDYNGALTLLRRAKPIAFAVKSEDKDAIQSKIDQYTQLAGTQSKVELAEKKLKANPWDKATHTTLIDLYLVELDDPASAAKHLEIGGDEAQKKLVPLAAKPVTEMNETQALELAGWYEGLGKKGTPATKIAMLARALGHYDRYLAAHLTEDVQRTAATLAQKRVTDALARLESEAGPTAKIADARIIDLLAPIDPSRDTRSGTWVKTTEGVSVERERGGGPGRGPDAGFALIESPVKIAGNYNLKVKFTKTSRNGGIAIVLPVGDRRVAFVMNMFPGDVAGLSDIGGKGANDNETKHEGSLQTDKAYILDAVVKVEADATTSIAITVDGKSYVAWKGKLADLSLNNAIRLSGEKTVAFAGVLSSVKVTDAKIKMLTGKAEATAKGSAPEKVAANNNNNNNPDDKRRDDFRKRFEDFFRGKGKGK